MIASLTSFLAPVLQSLIASTIFESGKASVTFLADIKSMENRYKKAFERAINRFYAEPEYAGNEARKAFSNYLEALKEDFKAERDFDPQKGQYKKLLELFEEEVCKDKRLRVWTQFKLLRISAGSLKQIESDQRAVLEQLAGARVENKQGLTDINDKLDVIVKSVQASPELKQVTVIPSSFSVLQYSDTDCLHIVKREALVQQCVQHCNEGKVLVLYGSVKTGKRTLSELILSNIEDGFVCTDVPSSHLNDVLRLCYHELRDGKKPIVTTDAPIDENMSLVDMSRVAQVEVPLLTEEETKELIDTYSPRLDFSKFIWAHSYGHPVLARALCTYLSCCNWVIDEKVFGQMLNYSFDHKLARSLAELMQRMIPDPDTRSLLNRLMLVKTVFSEDDVKALASVSPQIAEPRSKLLSLTPGWVTEENGSFKVTPLYDKAWTPDMDGVCYRSCNWLLASRIMIKTEPLNELDVLHYILYAQNAERYDEAGLMYMRALEKIRKEDLSKLTILPSMWVDVPLPIMMTENLRIAIRVQQLTILKDLSSSKRNYILDDLCRIIEGAAENELTAAYYSVLSVLCWTEDRIQAGLKYHNLSIEKRNKNSMGADELDEMDELYKKSIWFLPLRFTKIDEFDTWLKDFAAKPFEYNHSDSDICEHCYLAGYQLVNREWKSWEQGDIIASLQQILDKSIEYKCPEMAISSLFQMMETFNKAGRYEDTRKVYSDYYTQFEEYPLAKVLLNGSMAYSIYSNKDVENKEIFPFIEAMQTAEYGEVIPNIHLHLGQIKAYVMSEADVQEGIAQLEKVIDYVQKPRHSSSVYEYYQCLGELSLMYWNAGDRVRSANVVSECVKYVTSEEGLRSPFAKTYLCLCDWLMVNYLDELGVREVPDGQQKSYHGMFTEQDSQSLDSLYSEDRIFTSSYLMYQMSNALKIEKLKTDWAYKVLEAIKSRGETKEIHFIATILVPVFLKEQDFDAVAQLAEISSKSQAMTFKAHPEMKRDSADSEFIEYVMTPALFLALRMAITGDGRGIEKIRNILQSYQPVINDEVVKAVIAVLERHEYDMDYIDSVQHFDINKYYPVYIFAYLITTLSVNSYLAFKLIVAVIVRLESDLVKVNGPEVKTVINEFIASFWRARIVTKPEEFVNYSFLVNKGMKVIDEYEGKENLANHTMFVVRNHLPFDIPLNEEQEKWLDA